MRPFKRVSFLAALLLATLLAGLSGCASSKPTVAIVEEKPLPHWYLNPPANDHQWLYGTGVGRSVAHARSEALEQLLSQLSISVHASLSVQTQSRQGDQVGYSQQMAHEVRTEIAQIRVGNHQLLEAKELASDRFAVLIRSDRQGFIDALSRDLHEKLDRLHADRSRLERSHILKRYGQLREAHEAHDQMVVTLTILRGLDPAYDARSIEASIGELLDAYAALRESLRFSLNGEGVHTQSMIAALRSGLSEAGYTLSDRTGEGRLHTRVEVQSALSQARGLQIADIILTLEVQDVHQQTIGGNRHTFRLGAERGLDRAIESAASQLERTIEREGILAVLGLEI